MAHNTIKVKKYADVIEELVAGAGITPGMFVEVGSAGTIAVNSVAGAEQLPPMVALEDDLQGKEISDAYIATDPVQVWIPGRGDMVYGILVTGENVAIGDPLYVDDAGKLAELTSGTQVAVGTAVEAVDATAADKRIIVRIK